MCLGPGTATGSLVTLAGSPTQARLTGHPTRIIALDRGRPGTARFRPSRLGNSRRGGSGDDEVYSTYSSGVTLTSGNVTPVLWFGQ